MSQREGYTLRDFLIISLLAALGVATKPLLNPLSRFLLGTFAIPGGVFFGGLYMMWLALARGIVGKAGSATFTAFIQGGMALVLGLVPIGGILSVLIFLLPGVSVDLVFLIPGGAKRYRLCRFILACLAANVIGITMVALVGGIVQRPLILLVIIGALSGGLGGLVGYMISERIPYGSAQTSS